MARPQRIHIEGAYYHVMLRGNGGQAIFADDADRHRLERLLVDGVARFGHRVHAYCWMTNHLHLCLQVGTVPLSNIMQNLAFRYTRGWNRRYSRVGHLFQGRYRALLAADDSYLLTLVRYIHRNPLEAGLASDAAAWPWSSHGAYVGRQRPPVWLTTRDVLARLAPDPALAARQMMAWIAEAPTDPAAQATIAAHEEALTAGAIAIGPPCGARRSDATLPWQIGAPPAQPFRPLPRDHRRQALGLAPAAPSPDVIVAAAARAALAPHADVVSPSRLAGAVMARGLAAVFALELSAATLTDMARHLRRDTASLSRAAANARTALATDPELATRFAAERAALIVGSGLQNCKTPAGQLGDCDRQSFAVLQA